MNSIRPQRLQCSRQAAGLVGRLAEVGKATLLIKDLCNDVYLLMSANYEAEMTELKTRYTEIQTQLSAYVRKAHSAKEFADLVEQYTNITEVIAELLHTLVEKIVVHEKEVVDGQIIMRVDIHYRFIGKVGSMNGENLQTPGLRRNTNLLAEAGAIAATGA